MCRRSFQPLSRSSACLGSSRADVVIVIVIMSEPLPQAKSQAQKRTLTEMEEEDASEDSHFFLRNPPLNPITAGQARLIIATDQSGDIQLYKGILEGGDNLPAFDAEEGSNPSKKRKCPQSTNPACSNEDSIAYTERWSIPDSPDWVWTEPEEEGIFAQLSGIVTQRFWLPPAFNVKWIGRNNDHGLFLVHMNHGFCYIDKSLTLCWRLAFTLSELRQRCEAGLLPIWACEELVLSKSPEEKDSATILRPVKSGNLRVQFPIASPPWSEVHYTNLVEKVLRLRSTSESLPSDDKMSDGHSDQNQPLPSDTMAERSTIDLSMSPKTVGFDLMVIDPDKPEIMEFDEV